MSENEVMRGLAITFGTIFGLLALLAIPLSCQPSESKVSCVGINPETFLLKNSEAVLVCHCMASGGRKCEVSRPENADNLENGGGGLNARQVKQ